MTKVNKHIRGIDEGLYRQAKADAVKRGITIGDWFNEAMVAKLKPAIRRVDGRPGSANS